MMEGLNCPSPLHLIVTIVDAHVRAVKSFIQANKGASRFMNVKCHVTSYRSWVQSFTDAHS